MQLITEENCQALTGHPLSYFVKLTGITRLHKDFEYKDAIDSNVVLIGEALTVEIETELIELSRTFYLKQLFVMNNSVISLNRELGGISINLLSEQVRQSTLANYKELRLIAYRSKKDNAYDGYAIWAKYGFQMHEDSQRNFDDLMTEMGLHYDNLLQLQLNEENTVWGKIGKTWTGFFLLSKKSASREILARALMNYRRKKMKFKGLKQFI